MIRAIVAATLCLVALMPFAHCEPLAVETSSRRGEMCLNGIWRFMPAVGPAAEEPKGDWGDMPVPGSWSGTGSLPGPTSQGKGPGWDLVKLPEVSRAWYEMTVSVPEAWQGRAVLLELTRVSTDAEVFANGIDCGRIEWPNGEVDITKAVRPGEPVTLRLLVVAVPEQGDVTVYMGVGTNQTWTQPARLASRGITGEAFLRSRPPGPHIGDVFVRPSVRRKSIALDVDILGMSQAADVIFTARMLDGSGKVEKVFSATKSLASVPTQTITLEEPWPNPRLWDIGQPHLYTLQLTTSGAGLDDEYPQVFGFREFWLDGLRFVLNGTEIRLRPVCLRDEWNTAAWVPEGISSTLDVFTTIGFNIGEHWPNDEDERGSVYLRDLWADIADRKGFLLAGDALSMNRYVYSPDWQYTWDKPGLKERWEQRMAAQLQRLRNHPSIVMWATSANFFGRYQDQAPTVIGTRGWYEHDQKAKAGLEGVGIIKRYDPTRPVFTHQGADIGDIHTCNVYLDLIPLQEREEWLSAYVKHADMPFLPIEFGTPLHTTFMRGRNGFGDAVVSEPLMTEFCGIYLGPEAYRLETDAYRERIEKTYQGPGRWSNWQNARELDQAPAFQAVQELFIRNTWRAWRTWGTTAGMVPWSMGHGWQVQSGKEYAPEALPVPAIQRGAYFPQLNKVDLHYLQPEGNWVTYPAGQALIDNDNVTLAWIAGPPEAFTAKDHSFESGETFAKQIVLINDERTAQAYRVRWTVEVGGKQVISDERSGRIGPARNLFLPVSFRAPGVDGKTDGRITMTADIGDRHHRDEFRFRVFPKEASGSLGARVRIFDPEGATTALLKSLGVTTAAWEGTPLPGKLVVLGRHALDGGVSPPGSIEKHVADGGRLLILGQSPDWLRKAMALRVARQVSRRFFPVASEAAHPLLAGLDAEDFRHWRGAGTLVPATAGGPDESPNTDPEYGWHWGNAGSVSSCAIEKPHYSGWRPILEGEFDLAYSPLMELSYGAGHAVLCTLDLEGRTQADPVAQRFARRLLAYAASAKSEPRAPATVYLGGAAGQKLLKGIGLKFEPAAALPTGPALAILGVDATVSAGDLEAFLRRGGKALLLPRKAGADPWGAVANEAPFRGATGVPSWPECRGLSLSDLRLRGTVNMAPVTTAAGVTAGAGGLLGRRTEGEGVAILLQMTSDMLPTRDRTYLRYSAWRLARTLTQLLANLGATFEMDARSLSPGWNLGWVPLPLAGEWLLRVEKLLPPATDPTARRQYPGRARETEGWEAPGLGPTGWRKMKLPGYWEAMPGVGEKDGSFWVRRDIDLPEEWVGQDLVLQLGAVDDSDTTWFNGTQIGATSGWNVPRSYRISGKLVRSGRNTIAIRVFDEYGSGGFGGRPDDMRIGRVVPVRQSEGEELLRNRDFGNDLQGWDLGVMGPAEAKATVTTEVPAELLGQRSVKIEVTKPSDTAWHVSFSQHGFAIRAGVHYIWTAWMRASTPCSIIAAIEKNHPPFGGAGLFENVRLTHEWKLVKLDFTPTESDDSVRFSFQELARQAVTYWFAAPSFSVAPDRTLPREVADMRTFYSSDFIEGHELGDDPYRYYRW